MSRSIFWNNTTLVFKRGKKEKNPHSSQQHCFVVPSLAEITVQLLVPSVALSAVLTLGSKEMAKDKRSCPWKEGGLRSHKQQQWLDGGGKKLMWIGQHDTQGDWWKWQRAGTEDAQAAGQSLCWAELRQGEGWCLVCRQDWCGSCGREVSVQKEAERYLKCSQ